MSTRRTAEIFMAGLPVFAILFVPIALHMDELYPWMRYWREAQREHAHATAEHGGEHSDASILGASVAVAQDRGHVDEVRSQAAQAGGHAHAGSHADAATHGEAAHGGGTHGAHHTPEHAAHEEVIKSKLAYLDQPFFLARAVGYIAVWILLSMFLFRTSTKQDQTKDVKLTARAQSFAPLCVMGFGLSLTFAAFDWVMSLEPTWFSTIFGVQYFSVGMVSSLAALVLTMHGLKQAGVYGDNLTVEHFHDVGKLMFGFLVFWAYISFSQFMLIWYASIPEETTYYHIRWEGGWRTYSLIMVLVHFVIPFFLLISRNVKRRVPVLAFGAGLLLVTHVIEVFWLVMPYASPGELTVHQLDVAALFAVGGAYLTAVFLLLRRVSLVPVGDPRLARSLHLQVG